MNDRKWIHGIWPRLCVFTFFIALAMLMTDSMVPLQDWTKNCIYGDMTIFSYIVSWGSHAIFNCPAHYYSPPIFYPYQNMLPGTDGIELVALLASPVWYLSRNPILTGNMALFLSHLFALCSAYAATRVVVSLPRAFSVLIAVLFAVNSDRLWHATGHLNLVWSGILPLIFAGVWRILENSNWRSSLLFSLSLGASIYFSVYFFVIGGLAGLTAFMLWAGCRKRFPSRNSILILLAGVIATTTLAVPKILVYQSASSRATSQRNSLAEAAQYSATLTGYLTPSSAEQTHYASYWNYVIPVNPRKPQRGEDAQFLGYLLLICLFAEGLRLYNRRRAFTSYDRLSALSIAASGFLILASFGPQFGFLWHDANGKVQSISPYSLLYYPYLSVTGFFRVPARLAFLVGWTILLPISVLCLNLQNRLSSAKQTTYTGVIVNLICFEHLPARPVPQISLPSMDAYKVLEQVDPSHTQPYVFAPAPRKLEGALRSCGNWRPTVNGWVGSPLGKEHDKFYQELFHFPTTATIAWLRNNKVPWVFVTTDSNKAQADKDANLQLVYRDTAVNLYRIR